LSGRLLSGRLGDRGPAQAAGQNRALNQKLEASAALLAAGAALAAASASAGDSLVHDPTNGAGAPPTLGAAAKATIGLAGGARGVPGVERRTHVVVAQHIAGTDDHGSPAFAARLVRCATIEYMRKLAQAKAKR
jgi:hypothetical protein